MKNKFISTLVSITFAFALAAMAVTAAAQSASTSTTNSANSPTRTDKSIAYHNGAILTGTQIVYVVWYGDWSNNTSQQLLLADFLSNLGSSPYFQINTGYPNSAGQAPSGDLTFGGSL